LGKILHFQNFKRNVDFEENLTALMREAKKLQKEEEGIKSGTGTIFKSTFAKMERMIERDISDTILQKANINSEYFLCGKYIAKVLAKAAESPPKSLYVIDYLAKVEDEKDYWHWQQAADLCFLICTLFTGRADHRMMKYEDYRRMGKSLYYTFHHKLANHENREQEEKDFGIGYSMSVNYETMAQITKHALF